MSHHPLGAGHRQRVSLDTDLRDQFVRRQAPVARQQRAGRRHVARVRNIVLFENIGGLAQLFFEGQIDGVADDAVRALHGGGDDLRHAPRFARIGALAPKHHRPIRNITPHHRRIGAALDDRRVQPRDGFRVDDIDAAIHAIVARDQQHIHPRLHLGAVVDHVADGDRRLFGNQRNRAHEYLQNTGSKVQGSRVQGQIGLGPIEPWNS